jgi:hypothetical protein
VLDDDIGRARQGITGSVTATSESVQGQEADEGHKMVEPNGGDASMIHRMSLFV